MLGECGMKKDRDLDSIIRHYVYEHLNAIVIGVLLLFSIVIRYHLMKHGTSNDYFAYIVPWVDAYKNSVRTAFKEGVGNYYIPYNVLLAFASKVNIETCYSVGTISCIFDYLTCFYIYRILSENFKGILSKASAMAISVFFLFVPTVVLNGAAWKQCDAIYSFFLVALLKCLLDGRVRAAFIMFGIAFSFKQQAIFIIPLLIILYFVNQNIKIVYWLYSILVYLVAGVPAIVMGRPALEVYSIYFDQASTYHQMTLNYPNLYMIALSEYEKCHIYALLLTVGVFALVFMYICNNLKKVTNRTMMPLALWVIWTCCMFLPSMHQRYDYMVAVLLIVCLPLVCRETVWQAVISMILFFAGNMQTYSHSLFVESDYNVLCVVFCNVVAYVIYCYILWLMVSKDVREEKV